MSSAGAVPLRIALLGADDTTPALVRAIGESSRFLLAGVCELDGSADAQISAALRPLGVRVFDAWEALLDLESIDAVAVARGPDDDRRAEQLRKLIQTGVPVLASHPVVDSMLIYYELDMIRRETLCVVLPNLGERHHPAVQSLAEFARQGAESPIGKIDQIVIERCITAPTKASVVAQFARDVDLVRSIVGDVTRLGAMAGAGPDSAYGSLGVQMSGPADVMARWSVVPIQTAAGARLTVLGTRGKAIVDIRPGTDPWSMELCGRDQAGERHYESWNPAAAALDELARAMRGQGAEPNWVDAARNVELAETIDRSLQKSRTIDLYYEDYSEAGTFKGTMTSVGCGLLLLGLFLVGAVAIAEQAGVPYVRAWPYLLLGVLGVFLVLQFLVLGSRKPETNPVEDIPRDSVV